MARMISPKVRAIPTWVMAPPETWLMTIAPVPAKTRPNVPKNSERYLFITFCTRQHRQLPHASLIRESSKNQARLIDRHRVDFRANLWVNSNGCPQNEAIGFGAHPSFAVIRGSSP